MNDSETRCSPANVLPCARFVRPTRSSAHGIPGGPQRAMEGTDHLLTLYVVALERPLLHNLAALDVPKLARPVGRARRDVLAVAVPARRKHALVVSDRVRARARAVCQSRAVLGRRAVVEQDLAVRSGRDEQRARRAVGDGLDEAGVAARGRGVLERDAVEEADAKVVRARPERGRGRSPRPSALACLLRERMFKLRTRL